MACRFSSALGGGIRTRETRVSFTDFRGQLNKLLADAAHDTLDRKGLSSIDLLFKS